MPAFQVSASIDINASQDTVHTALVDYNTWPIWSPWLYMERTAKVNVVGTPGEPGHGYDWTGEKVGAGKMSLRSSTPGRIESDLHFLKPFKSYADIAFDLESLSDKQTRVTWHMDSSLPFFMFFMLGTMKGMIRNDYKRGLTMFKDYMEQGSIASTTSVEGVVDAPEQTYAGQRRDTHMDDMAESMPAAFSNVYTFVTENGFTDAGTPFSIYDRMDIKNSLCTFTAAIPVAGDVSGSADVSIGTRPACRAFKVVHAGPYRHLGNAWAMAMSDMRHAKIKASKKQPPFEQYLNDPDQTAESDLLTEIYIPVK